MSHLMDDDGGHRSIQTHEIQFAMHNMSAAASSVVPPLDVVTRQEWEIKTVRRRPRQRARSFDK